MKEQYQRNRAYVIMTIPVVLVSFITGIGNLVPFPHIESDLYHLGYPPYFRIILGTWKVMAAVVLVIPKRLWIKDLAYMGILLDLTGAASSRLAVGDGAIKVILPLAISILVAISWWYFRQVRTASQ